MVNNILAMCEIEDEEGFICIAPDPFFLRFFGISLPREGLLPPKVKNRPRTNVTTSYAALERSFWYNGVKYPSTSFNSFSEKT